LTIHNLIPLKDSTQDDAPGASKLRNFTMYVLPNDVTCVILISFSFFFVVRFKCGNIIGFGPSNTTFDDDKVCELGHGVSGLFQKGRLHGLAIASGILTYALYNTKQLFFFSLFYFSLYHST
jgi:hypothetical protein